MKNAISRLYQMSKYAYRKFIEFRHLKTGIECESQWYGNNYGGFFIYPNLINSETIVYSFGIGEDISFDISLIKDHGCKIWGFDPTPKSIKWIAGQTLPKEFHFFDVGISQKSGHELFHLPKNQNHVSGSVIQHENVSNENVVEVEMKSFNDITTLLKHKHIGVLKMDIEGSEYKVIDSILNSEIEIDQFAIELHERFFSDGKQKSIQLINKLRNADYEIFAISKSFQEISFIRKDLCKN